MRLVNLVVLFSMVIILAVSPVSTTYADEEKDLTTLIRFLKAEKPEVRKWAIKLIGKMGSNAEEAIPHLVKLFEDKDLDVGLHSAVALANIGEKALLPLVKALKNKSKHIQNLAGLGLRRMDHKGLGNLVLTEKENWRDWDYKWFYPQKEYEGIIAPFYTWFSSSSYKKLTIKFDGKVVGDSKRLFDCNGGICTYIFPGSGGYETCNIIRGPTHFKKENDSYYYRYHLAQVCFKANESESGSQIYRTEWIKKK